MSYFTISMDTLGNDAMMLLVTVLMYVTFFKILKNKSAIDGEGRCIGLPGVVDGSGLLFLYLFVCASALGFTESSPSLFKTISMIIGGFFIAGISVITVCTLFERNKNKYKS